MEGPPEMIFLHAMHSRSAADRHHTGLWARAGWGLREIVRGLLMCSNKKAESADESLGGGSARTRWIRQCASCLEAQRQATCE